MSYPPIFSCTESTPGHLMRNKQCTDIKSHDTIVTDEKQSSYQYGQLYTLEARLA